jgi:hypothetical protein
MQTGSARIKETAGRRNLMKKTILTLLCGIFSTALVHANPPPLPRFYPIEPPDILGQFQEQQFENQLQAQLDDVFAEQRYQSELLEQQRELARIQLLQQQEQLKQQRELQEQLQKELEDQQFDRDLERLNRQVNKRPIFQPE